MREVKKLNLCNVYGGYRAYKIMNYYEFCLIMFMSIVDEDIFFWVFLINDELNSLRIV